MKVNWAVEVPEEIKATIEPLIERWRPFLPLWVEHLTVTWESHEQFCLSTTVLVEYRLVRLSVHPGFLDESAERRSSAVLHEFIHAAIEPMKDVYHELGSAVVGDDNDALRKWAQESWRKAMESAVVDIEHGIGRLLGSA